MRSKTLRVTKIDKLMTYGAITAGWDQYKAHKYSVGRKQNFWMSNTVAHEINITL
jgi:hypothetical protein